MLDQLLKIDISLTGFFHNLIPHFFLFEYLFSFFSLNGMSFIIWIIIFLFVIIKDERRDHKFVIYFGISLITTSIFVNYILKNIFQRSRPFFTDLNRFQLIQPIQLNSCPLDFSFPSSHAAIAFSAAVILSSYDKKRKWFYYGIALLISYSRIYLGCHYFFDIFIGGLIGYFISKIILSIK